MLLDLTSKMELGSFMLSVIFILGFIYLFWKRINGDSQFFPTILQIEHRSSGWWHTPWPSLPILIFLLSFVLKYSLQMPVVSVNVYGFFRIAV